MALADVNLNFMIDKIKNFILKNKLTLSIVVGVILLSVFSLNPASNLPKTPLPPIPTPNVSPTPYVGTRTGQQAVQQSMADREVGLSVNKTLNQYPFITKLPLITQNYTAIFDFKKQVIRVRMQQGFTSQFIESDVKKRLSDIGVPESIQIEYLKFNDPTP